MKLNIHGTMHRTTYGTMHGTIQYAWNYTWNCALNSCTELGCMYQTIQGSKSGTMHETMHLKAYNDLGFCLTIHQAIYLIKTMKNMNHTL